MREGPDWVDAALKVADPRSVPVRGLTACSYPEREGPDWVDADLQAWAVDPRSAPGPELTAHLSPAPVDLGSEAAGLKVVGRPPDLALGLGRSNFL